MNVIITTSTNGKEVGRQIAREQDMQGAVSSAVYTAASLSRDPQTGVLTSFPRIEVVIEEEPQDNGA